MTESKNQRNIIFCQWLFFFLAAVGFAFRIWTGHTLPGSNAHTSSGYNAVGHRTLKSFCVKLVKFHKWKALCELYFIIQNKYFWDLGPFYFLFSKRYFKMTRNETKEEKFWINIYETIIAQYLCFPFQRLPISLHLKISQAQLFLVRTLKES